MQTNNEPHGPDWNLLIAFGMPLNPRGQHPAQPSFDEVWIALRAAVVFARDSSGFQADGRLKDAFKALLLTLKTHYPTLYHRLAGQCACDLHKTFDLGRISGRDIKLRNIALSGVSRFFRDYRLRALCSTKTNTDRRSPAAPFAKREYCDALQTPDQSCRQPARQCAATMTYPDFSFNQLHAMARIDSFD
jgi:hypothetical protein